MKTELPENWGELMASKNEFPQTLLKDDAGKIIFSVNSGEDITERRRAEEALREAEEKYRVLFETSRDAIMLLDRETVFDCNQACLDIYGCASKEQFVRKHPAEWSPSKQADGRDSREVAREHIERAFQEGAHLFEWIHKRQDGTTFPAEVLISCPGYGNRNVLQVVVRDISDRKHAEERLSASEKKYRNMFENAVEGMYQTTPEGRILSVNPAQAKMFGYETPQEMLNDAQNVGQTYYVHPADRVRFQELLERQGYVAGFEVENYTKNREKIWISLNTRAVKDATGRILYYEGITENITQRKLAEKALADSERRLSEIAEFLPDPTFVINLKGEVVLWNRAMEAMTGVPAKDMIGKDNYEHALPFYQVRRPMLIDHVYHPEGFSKYYTFIRNEGDTLWGEADLRINGKRFVLSGRAKLLCDSRGAVVGAIESIRDITDRKMMEVEIRRMNEELQQTVTERTAELLKANRALEQDIEERIRVEEAVRESERRYREMAELLPETIFECDETGKLTFVNGQYYAKFGYSPEEFDRGLNIFQMLIPDDRERAQDAVRQILTGVRRSGAEYTGLRKNGEAFPILVNSSPLEYQGHYIGMRGFAIDISEHKRMAAERLKVQKLESIGILAGGIAHDFNNLLAAILGYIDLVRLNLPPEQKNDQDLERARNACLQASELTKRLITFSKGGEPLCQEISLVGLIKGTCDQTLRDSSVQYRMTFVERLWPVFADIGQLKQVVHHLVLNAREAMPDGGRIVISAENVVVDERTDLPLKRGAYVKWSMRDSGQGISRENLTRIFDPYFTTKDRGSEKGMGLGLAICYSVVKRHNGLILATSEPGVGSTFSVYLPAVVSAGIIPERFDFAQQESPVAVAVSAGRILLMDDEELIRDLMCAMLGAFGYHVEMAKNGDEAVDLYRKALAAGQPFAATILDLEIPGGLGGEFAIRQLLELDSGIKAIVASGYSNDPILKDYQRYGFKGAIAKPFTMEDLGKILEEVIGNGP